ncbi:unnamed protein product [Darwinula stevensoni]|uniref:Uncharacterized protein n=1 Tax=Darwinula stevensoni TaxID=69355 RepID=A0A7R9FU44_9CRUS|nr:unnamed protein product [Darwinula stevensoni]CAG0906907.1 unnamed protein product [Darwinula stevensoni]
MEYEDVEFFRKNRRRVILGTVGSFVVGFAVAIVALAVVFAYVEDVGTTVAIILLLVLLYTVSYALLVYAISVEAEKDRRHRCRARGFDADAFVTPNVPYVFIFPGEKVSKNQYYTISMPRQVEAEQKFHRALVHSDVLAQVIGKTVPHQRLPRMGQLCVLVVGVPRRQELLSEVWVFPAGPIESASTSQ